MADDVEQAGVAADPVQVYVDSLFAALGSRDALEVLDETPAALRRAASGLSAGQLSTVEAPGKWSVRQVVQHLADSELVGAFRFRMILAHDRPELPGYDQDLWADRLRYQEADLEAALHDFATLRAGNLRLFRRLTPDGWQRGMLHSERGEEKLEKIVRMYAGHDLVHLRQIERIRRAIGPGGATGSRAPAS
ncbi:MAG TPA: DinB family protein [Thermoanaerobaculia bacterium]|nr:DinB family protein [Thermoanaerobaculia bacterium]